MAERPGADRNSSTIEKNDGGGLCLSTDTGLVIIECGNSRRLFVTVYW